MSDLQLFGQRVKRLRQELGLSQRDFAEKVGVTASALSAYEKGAKNPSVNVAINIASAFNSSLDWLCGLTEEVTRFRPDFDTPFDLPKALEGLLHLIEFGLIEYEVAPERPISKLDISDGPLQEFLLQTDKLTNLLFSGAVSDELYRLCIDNLVYTTAHSMQYLRKKHGDEGRSQIATSELPF